MKKSRQELGKKRAQTRTSHLPLHSQAAQERVRVEGAEFPAPRNLVLDSLAHLKLLHQVHICTFVFLHAALRDAGHVCSQCSIDKHTQHVQHSSEKLTVAGREKTREARLRKKGPKRSQAGMESVVPAAGIWQGLRGMVCRGRDAHLLDCMSTVPLMMISRRSWAHSVVC